MFEVYLSTESLKTLKKLEKKIAKKIKKLLLTLKTSPLPIKKYDLKKISGTKDTYRVRISKYRIIYKIDWNGKEIKVNNIAEKGGLDNVKSCK